MFFKEISYEKNFRVNALDQFIYEKISAKVELNDTDNPMNAITMAKEFVNEQGSKACQYPEQHIQEKYIGKGASFSLVNQSQIAARFG